MSGSGDIASAQPQTPPLRRSRWVVRALLLAAAAGGVLGFLQRFDHGVNQLDVIGLWLMPLGAWVWFVSTLGTAPMFGLRWRPADYWPLAVLLPLFACCWLPFYDNWRWAYTGDSFGVYGVGYWFAQKGLRQSLLSVHGIDNAFTILWESTYHLPMYLFGPSLFWQRVGQLSMACAALAAIYAYFRMVVGRLWAAAIVMVTASNYVWLWVTYVSYLKIDSNVFYFVMLGWTTLVWRHPERYGLWMLAGYTAGLSLFYTPSAWAGIMCMGLFLAAYGLWQRRPGVVAVSGVSAVLVAVPILIEVPWMLEMVRIQALPMTAERASFFPGWEYVWRIFQEIVLSPYFSVIDKLGVSGAFFRPPLTHTYLAGLALSFLALLPPLRRRLRLPEAVPALLLLFLLDALFLALTNKGYGNVSHKRSYNLIPLQVFFAVLPFCAVHAWRGSGRLWRPAVVSLFAVSYLSYALLNLQAIMYPHKAMYGGNLFDGLIELRQRYPRQEVVLFTTRDLSEPFGEDSLFQYAYGILDNLTITRRFTEEEVDRVCRRQGLLCYEPNFDRDRFDPLLERREGILAEFEVLNSHELRCFACIASR